MVKTELFKTRSDGVRLVRSWSDKGMLIERDGIQYAEAIDPENTGRKYTETNVPVDDDAALGSKLSAIERAYKKGVQEA